MKHPSIRKRLLLACASVSTGLLILVSIWLYSKVEKSLEHHFDGQLKEKVTLVMAEIELRKSGVHHKWHEALVRDEHRMGSALVQVWDQGTGESVRSPRLDGRDLERHYGEPGELVFYHTVFSDGTEGRSVGVLSYPVTQDEGDSGSDPLNHPQIVVCSESDNDFHDILNRTQRAFFLEGGALVILLGVVIWWVIGRLLRPLEVMAEELGKRQADEIGHPLEIHERIPSELKGMTETFNDLLQRVEQARTKDRSFFLNFAHEVRTPVAGFNAVLEQAVKSRRDPQEYERRIRDALGIGENLGRLIHRLLDFGRITHSHSLARALPFDFNQLVQESWDIVSKKKNARSLAIQWSLSPENPLLRSDRDLVQIVLLNLIENAVSYGDPDSPISIVSSSEKGGVGFAIRNAVIGEMPSKAETRQFFEPFYRRDKARSREDGHAGLGLSFCREIMQVLGGYMQVSRPEGSELEFRVLFPNSNGSEAAQAEAALRREPGLTRISHPRLAESGSD
jgi:signal transduction histidine kinase